MKQRGLLYEIERLENSRRQSSTFPFDMARIYSHKRQSHGPVLCGEREGGGREGLPPRNNAAPLWGTPRPGRGTLNKLDREISKIQEYVHG